MNLRVNLKLRISEVSRLALERQAKSHGMKLSVYCRARLLGTINRMEKVKKAPHSCNLADLPRHIPSNTYFKCPVKRSVLLDNRDKVVGQAIGYYGAESEHFLILEEHNAEYRWVWVTTAPLHESKVVIWQSGLP